MLKISTEYHKGVFFVRIVGRNDNGRKLKEIFNMIDELGIRLFNNTFIHLEQELDVFSYL